MQDNSMTNLDKYKQFMENNNNELDPYGEEVWNEKPVEIDKEKFVRDIVDDIMGDMYNWRDWIEDHLYNYFRAMDIDDLKDFYSIEDEMCEECGGDGYVEDENVPCEECGGTGYVDGYLNRYGLR